MEWISCTDRLPEDDQTVWMMEQGQTLLPILGYYDTSDIPGFYPIHVFESYRIHVTHWMPIPKMPK